MLQIARSSACKGADHSRPRTFTEPLIVIDSREQNPYAFPGAVTKALSAGDYSVLGHEDRVAIERKSKADAYRSVGHARERFKREIERLAVYKYAAVVIESSLPAFLIPPPFGELHPHAAIGTLLSWSVKYRLPIFFAGDREHAEALTRKLLEKFAWYASQGEADVR
jgi:DNA excision repair protein ERCC-4